MHESKEDYLARLEADRIHQERCDRAVLDNHDAPAEWLVAVTDPEGARILSETFGGDYSLEQIREQALRHFDPPPGHTLRFYPIGLERGDLVTDIA